MEAIRILFVLIIVLCGISNVYANGAQCDGVFGSARVDIATSTGQTDLALGTDRFVGNLEVVYTDSPTAPKPYTIEGTWTHVSANGDRWLLSNITYAVCVSGGSASMGGYGTVNGGVDEYWIEFDIYPPELSSGYCPLASYGFVVCLPNTGCNTPGDWYINRWGYITRGTYQVR